MMPYGHLGAAYLISQTPALAGGNPLTIPEILMVVIAANLPDLDFIYCLIRKRKVEEHHSYFTHTPAGLAVISLVWIFTLGRVFPAELNLLLIAALFSHLFLDEAAYWLYKLKLQEIVVHSQINWYYPFRPFTMKSDRGNLEVFKEYLLKAKASFLLEVGLFLLALIILIKELFRL